MSIDTCGLAGLSFYMVMLFIFGSKYYKYLSLFEAKNYIIQMCTQM